MNGRSQVRMPKPMSLTRGAMVIVERGAFRRDMLIEKALEIVCRVTISRAAVKREQGSEMRMPYPPSGSDQTSVLLVLARNLVTVPAIVSRYGGALPLRYVLFRFSRPK